LKIEPMKSDYYDILLENISGMFKS
jgi:hypothetical protein